MIASFTLKKGTWMTLSNLKLEDILTKPTWVSNTLDPFGSWTKTLSSLITLDKRLNEHTTWSEAPIFMIHDAEKWIWKVDVLEIEAGRDRLDEP